METRLDKKGNIKLGYCCLNTELRTKDIFSSRTCRLETIKNCGIQHSYKLAKQNLLDTIKIIKWNYNNNIYNFRISSELFPFATHINYRSNYDINQFQSLLTEIGNLSKKFNQRLSFHVGQFNVLASQTEKTVVNTIYELDLTAQILDMMDVDQNGIIIIHIGSKNPSKTIALNTFKNNYYKLSKSAQQRLVIENCEMMYTIEDLLPLSNEIKIPIVVDSHHYLLNPGSNQNTFLELIHKVLTIWDYRNIDALFHISELCPGITLKDSMIKKRKHSDFVQNIPHEYIFISQNRPLYIDIEAKKKEQAVLLLFQKYFL